MREVTGAVIATSLVLVAVFVPVALFPGTTGILFRQFALTIAFSVAISAFNALTLTPSLSAILLGHHRERSQGRFFKAFNRVVASGTEGYRRALAVAIRWKFAALLAFALLLGATYVLYNRVPQGFIPEDDQGYLIVAVNAPQGASLQYTLGVCSQVEKVASQSKDIEGTFAIGGFGFSGSASNRAIVFLPRVQLSSGRPGTQFAAGHFERHQQTYPRGKFEQGSDRAVHQLHGQRPAVPGAH